MSDVGGGAPATPAASNSGGVSSGGGSASTGSGKAVSATTSGTAAIAAKMGQAQGKAAPQPQQAQGAPEAGAETLTAAEKRELLELDIDGEVIEYDYSDRERLKRDLQRRFGAEKRMAEAAKIRKQAEAFVEGLKANPIAALEQLGIDVRGVSEGYLKKQIEQELLKEQDPARWQLEQERAKLEAERSEVERFKEQQKAQQFEAQKQHAAAQLEKKFMAALQVDGLPKTPYTVKAMALLQKQARANGYDLEPAELAEVVSQNLRGDLKAVVGGMDAKSLMAFLGDDIIAKIREADLARFQRPTAQPVQGKPNGAAKTPAKKMTIQEFMSRHG